MLNWSQQDLADAAELSISTVRDFELGKRLASESSVAAMKEALEREGLEFLEDFSPNADGRKGGFGVRFQRPSLTPREAVTDEEKLQVVAEMVWKAGQLARENPKDPAALKEWDRWNSALGALLSKPPKGNQSKGRG